MIEVNRLKQLMTEAPTMNDCQEASCSCILWANREGRPINNGEYQMEIEAQAMLEQTKKALLGACI